MCEVRTISEISIIKRNSIMIHSRFKKVITVFTCLLTYMIMDSSAQLHPSILAWDGTKETKFFKFVKE